MRGGGPTGAPCLQRALAESQDIVDAVKSGRVAELRLSDESKRALAAGEPMTAFSAALGWLQGAVAAHVGGFCACSWITDTTSRIRPASPEVADA